MARRNLLRDVTLSGLVAAVVYGTVVWAVTKAPDVAVDRAISPRPPATSTSPQVEAPGRTQSTPSVPEATTAVPPTTETTVTDGVGVVDRGVCGRPVDHLGQELPHVTEAFAGGPIGAPVKVVFAKKARGHPADDGSNLITILDGRCEVENLFTVRRGERYETTVDRGQLLLVSLPDDHQRFTWVVAHEDFFDLG